VLPSQHCELTGWDNLKFREEQRTRRIEATEDESKQTFMLLKLGNVISE